MIEQRYVVGLDLGPVTEFTALAVVERSDETHGSEELPPIFAVRHLQRFAPATPYSTIATAVDELLATKPLTQAPLVMDITAVGSGLLKLFRGNEQSRELLPVVIVAGQHAGWSGHGEWRIPKKDLVTGLQLLFQGRRLSIPRSLPEADLLVQELGNFRAHVSLASDPSQADWREGRDDDLVLAVALACWQANRLERCNGPSAEIISRRINPLSPGIYVPGGRWRW